MEYVRDTCHPQGEPGLHVVSRALDPSRGFAGKYRQGDEKKIEPGPTAVCADFPSAVQLILEQLDS